MDAFGGRNLDPASLHRYLYTKSCPVNLIDPSGYETLAEILGVSAITIAAVTLAGRAAIIGVISAGKGGLPDAVAFGIYGAGGISLPFLSTIGIDIAAILGFEIIFAPRLRKMAIFEFGGFEPSWAPPTDDHHGLAHGEFGGFEEWIWGLDELEGNPEKFIFSGIAGYGGFVGFEPHGDQLQSVLFGISSNFDPSVYGVYGKTRSRFVAEMSYTEMLTAVAGFESFMTTIIDLRLAGWASLPIALGAGYIGGTAAAFWVKATYGKNEGHH